MTDRHLWGRAGGARNSRNGKRINLGDCRGNRSGWACTHHSSYPGSISPALACRETRSCSASARISCAQLSHRAFHRRVYYRHHRTGAGLHLNAFKPGCYAPAIKTYACMGERNGWSPPICMRASRTADTIESKDNPRS